MSAGRETRGTVVGPITVEDNGRAITIIAFGGAEDNAPSALTRRAFEQLEAYFAGRLHAFDLPLAPEGTLFQQRVWAALRDIPYGETRSYADIAHAIGRPGAARAVGQANHNNPIAIVIPCHRVVAADGSLGGYGGGLFVKRALLELEGVTMAAPES